MSEKLLTIDVSHGTTHDGPGMRTTVFVKGCPLHCLWCQNPESIAVRNEVWWEQKDCIGCHFCLDACTSGALTGDEAGLEAAKEDLLDCLSSLKDEFAKFANIDFPEEYDYLEKMADEADDYMTEAVNTYNAMYGTEDGFNVNLEEYADENYDRAYKRVRIITALLRGETPDEEGLIVQ